MGFLQDIGFVKKDVAPKVPETPVVPINTPVVRPVAVGGGVLPSTSVPLQGGTDYNSHFDAVLTGLSLEKPGYLELAKSIQGMTGLSEKQAYTAAYSMFAAMNVTPAKLIDSARKCLGALEAEEQSFQQGVATSEKETVTDVAEEIVSEQNAIEELMRQVEQKNLRINQLAQQKDEAALSIANEVTNFTTTLAKRREVINSHITKIQTYLQNATNT